MPPFLALLGVSFLSATLTVGQTLSYAATTNVQCPSTPLVRSFSPLNQSLNPQEVGYVGSRAATLPSAWASWIRNASALGYDLTTLGGANGANFPKVGIAVSGGGFRAAQCKSSICRSLVNKFSPHVARLQMVLVLYRLSTLGMRRPSLLERVVFCRLRPTYRVSLVSPLFPRAYGASF